MGSERHLSALVSDALFSSEAAGPSPRRLQMDTDLGAALSEVAALRDGGESVCVLASGDPGFFGLVRLASVRLGAGRFRVHPAPTSVALAFAHLGINWDDAVVVSAHGRPLDPAAQSVLNHPKVAILVSPDNPPQALGQRLVDLGCPPRTVTVLSRLGEVEESVWEGDVRGLATGEFDPMAVVICTVASPGAWDGPGWAWGRDNSRYEHRAGMITKAEVRSVALGKLAIPAAGVLWDVGAGSGSVAAECSDISPGLRVFAVERNADDVARLRRNLAGSVVQVVHGEAPGALAGLPDPDRVFVGGGGIEVLRSVLGRVRPGGTVVATYAALDRAAAGAALLGRMIQLSVSRAVPIGLEGALRLEAENPVFVCWGSVP
jgi:precorrin-6y C5,15-methyltransferase (decarboxylating) CbiE subunit/precorrin-6Y C5,15-methyltransferase (decarboxylating) CbiT subunit